MKHIIIIFLSSFSILSASMGQDQNEAIGQCVLKTGENTTYLRDFVIELPEAVNIKTLPSYKTYIYLMKEQKYRFTMCDYNETGSNKLILSLYDDNKLIVSSETNNKTYSSVDFLCSKTGLYTISYSFRNGDEGSGVGVISMVN